MPYKSSDVPSGTEKVPAHGKSIYRAAFNSAYEKYGEERAHAIAWSAVKKKFKKKGARWVGKDALDTLFDEEVGHPFRGNQYTTGESGGGKGEGNGKGAGKAEGEHPGKGYSKEATVDKKGVIHTSDVNDAVKALTEGRKVELNQPDEVSTLLHKLGDVSKDMINKGEKAPNFDLCNVSVKGTNLFCAESLGIKREDMPQLPNDTSGFVDYLKKAGYGVKDDEEYASHLRATQNELKGAQVAGLADFLQSGTAKANEVRDQPIIISRDNYVLDGHHRWAAMVGIDAANNVLSDDKKMKVRRVDTNIVNLLYLGEDFTGGKGHKSAKDARRQLAQMKKTIDHKRGARFAYKDGDCDMAIDKEFSTERRETLAKQGKAMPGGGYPIENKGDLSNAIRAFGRAKNKPAAKAWIKKRARALGATEMLPENWDAVAAWELLGIESSEHAQELHDAWAAVDAFKRKNGDDDDEEDDDDQYDELHRQVDHNTVHLTDSFIMDKKPRRTKDGYLVADARIARTGIQLYAGEEIGAPDMEVVRVYRPPEEVFSKAAMQSLAHKPITLNHPPVMIDANNWDEYSVGHTGDEVTRDGECVRVPMVIMDAKAIKAYEKHGVKELSVGYSTDLKWGKGRTPTGEVYDAKQTEIRGNHLAVVPAARGGSRLCIGDDNERKGVDIMKLLIDGQTIEFEDELAGKHVQSHIVALQKTIADQKTKIDEDEAEEEQEEEKKTRAEKDAAAMKGEIAALKKQLEDATAKLSDAVLDKLIEDRIDLRMKAHAAMDGKVDFTGKSPAEIRRTVVMAKLGDAAKNLSDDEVVGAFKYAVADIKPQSGTDRLADSLSLLSLGGGNNRNDPKTIKDAAYEEYVKGLTTAWRGPRAAQ